MGHIQCRQAHSRSAGEGRQHGHPWLHSSIHIHVLHQWGSLYTTEPHALHAPYAQQSRRAYIGVHHCMAPHLQSPLHGTTSPVPPSPRLGDRRTVNPRSETPWYIEHMMDRMAHRARDMTRWHRAHGQDGVTTAHGQALAHRAHDMTRDRIAQIK